MAKSSTQAHSKQLIVAVLTVLIVFALVVFVIYALSTNRSTKPSITEAQSVQLAQKYFGNKSSGSELKKLYDLDGGWCYGMMPTNGEESTGGVMLCIDDKGQGYEIVSFMNYPKDGDSIYDYTSGLEQEYSTKPKFKGQNSWNIKVDI